jgi:hypothetical protein
MEENQELMRMGQWNTQAGKAGVGMERSSAETRQQQWALAEESRTCEEE